jgi:outer membrane protein
MIERSIRAALGVAACLSSVVLGVVSATAEQSGPGVGFELGGGVQVRPSYEGADSFAVGGYPIIKFNRLELKNGFSLGGGDSTGFGFRPSFNVRGERNAADHPELNGLKAVDTAVELGLGADYEFDMARFSGEFRRGVTGHDGFVGEAGVQLIARPMEGLSLSAGPRLSFADSEYMNTYFGVTAAEAVASGRPAFTADGGLKSAGIAASVRYEVTTDWGIEGSVAWDRLVGDAADSPIVATGSADQYTMRIGLFRKFAVNF